MKITKLSWIVALGAIALSLSACGSTNPSITPLATRVATQTPWIIYQVVSPTPEPPTVTPLPAATEAKSKTPTRAATAKPVATAVKPATAPVVVVAQPTAAPACNLGAVTLVEPEPNAARNTKEVGVGGDTFRFIWNPPVSMQGNNDPTLGYQLTIKATHNGTTIYLSNNKFSKDGKIYILDKPAVSALAGGAATVVTWDVTTIKVTSGGFNDSDPSVRPASFVPCGSPSETRAINLGVYE